MGGMAVRAREGAAGATVAAALAAGTARLAAAGVENPRAEARRLLLEAAGLSHETALAHPDRAVTGEGWARYEAYLARRENREPIQYILGRAEFYSREFHVNRQVLIPRPETELLVELAVAHLVTAFPGEAGIRLADLGTGSGVLAVTLALELPGARVEAVDLSPEALAVAEANARRLGASPRVRFHLGDFWAPLRACGLLGRLHAAVANPPYVADGEAERLMPEVGRYEPPEALFAGPDGLACLRRIAAGAPAFLRPGGALFLEVGAGQARTVAALLEASGAWRRVAIHADFAGVERVVAAVRGEAA